MRFRWMLCAVDWVTLTPCSIWTWITVQVQERVQTLTASPLDWQSNPLTPRTTKRSIRWRRRHCRWLAVKLKAIDDEAVTSWWKCEAAVCCLISSMLCCLYWAFLLSVYGIYSAAVFQNLLHWFFRRKCIVAVYSLISTALHSARSFC